MENNISASDKLECTDQILSVHYKAVHNVKLLQEMQLFVFVYNHQIFISVDVTEYYLQSSGVHFF